MTGKNWAIFLIFALIVLLAVRKFLPNSTKRRYDKQHKKWRKWQKKTERKAERELQLKQVVQPYHSKKAHKEWEKEQKRQKPNANERFENNPDWVWDEEHKMWRHKKYWNNKVQ